MKRVYGLIKRFQSRHNIIPFEGGFALFAIYSSLVGLFGFGVIPSAVSRELGNIFTVTSNFVFLIAGLGMYFGVGFGRRDFEAFGLILTMASLLCRMLLAHWVLGFDSVTFNNYMYNTIFIVVCIIRLSTVFQKHIIIRLEDVPPLHNLEHGKYNISFSES